MARRTPVHSQAVLRQVGPDTRPAGRRHQGQLHRLGRAGQWRRSRAQGWGPARRFQRGDGSAGDLPGPRDQPAHRLRQRAQRHAARTAAPRQDAAESGSSSPGPLCAQQIHTGLPRLAQGQPASCMSGGVPKNLRLQPLQKPPVAAMPTTGSPAQPSSRGTVTFQVLSKQRSPSTVTSTVVEKW